MWTLKSINLTFKQVKTICASFNKADLCTDKIKLVGIPGEAMLVDLILKISALPDESMAKIPGDVQVAYAALPEEVFNANIAPEDLAAGTTEDAPVAETVTLTPDENPETEVVVSDGETPAETAEAALISDSHVSNCPIFGKGFNAREPECQTCNKDFHADYINCKRLVKGIGEAAKKKSTRAGAGAPRKTASYMRSRYGHRVNTMAACVDDLVWAGTSFPVIVDTLMKWYGKSESAAKHAFNVHAKYLGIKHGITVTVDAANFVKSDIEFIPTQNASNSSEAVPNIVQEEFTPTV